MTTQLIPGEKPRAYTGIERDQHAAEIVKTLLSQHTHTCQVGTVQETGLGETAATVVVGEAYLSMQPDPVKAKIAAEAFRILRPSGRYGLHELALSPDTMGTEQQDASGGIGQAYSAYSTRSGRLRRAVGVRGLGSCPAAGWQWPRLGQEGPERRLVGVLHEG